MAGRLLVGPTEVGIATIPPRWISGEKPVFGFRVLKVSFIALAATLMLSASQPSCSTVFAQGSECSEACKAAYGNCYKSNHNRGVCEAQLQRCLQGCIAGKRG
jgi:hypothetical protein